MERGAKDGFAEQFGRASIGLGLALALYGGLLGTWATVRELDTLAEVPGALAGDQDERIRAALDALRPGSGALFDLCRRELPADAVLLGLHPTGLDEADDPGLAADRAASLAVLGELQLLLHPRQVLSAGALGLEITPGWLPPPTIPPARAYLLDLAFPHPERLGAWTLVGATPGGRLLALAPEAGP